MRSEWPRVVISDVCELIVDCVNKTAPVVEGPTPFKMLRTPNVKNGVVNTDNCRFVESSTFEKWTRRADVKAGDVLLTREAPLGQVGIVTSKEKLFLGQRLMQYRANPLTLDSRFLLYSFLSHDLQHQFSLHEGSGSVVSHIRVGDCLKFKLNLPPLGEQKRISNALGCIDKKIQLNRQTNQTLEAMAQALFKSWFVDFDPVIDNALAAGNPIPAPFQKRAEQRAQQRAAAKFSTATLPDDIRQHFPCEFEHTEALGWVPLGWKSGKLNDLIILQRGFDLPKPKRTEGKYPLVTSSGQDGYHGEFKVEGPGLVTGRSGRIGVVTFVDDDFWPLNTTLWVKKYVSSSPFHGYYLLKSINFDNYAAGSAVPTLNRNHIHEHPCTIPTKRIIKAFDKFITPYFSKIKENKNSCSNLEKLRDTLLPKLISGELRLPPEPTP